VNHESDKALVPFAFPRQPTGCTGACVETDLGALGGRVGDLHHELEALQRDRNDQGCGPCHQPCRGRTFPAEAMVDGTLWVEEDAEGRCKPLVDDGLTSGNSDSLAISA
jgi:hypothetical protein